jgi:hypothetical protein
VIVHRDTAPFRDSSERFESKSHEKIKAMCRGPETWYFSMPMLLADDFQVLEHRVSPTFEELTQRCVAWASDMKDLHGRFAATWGVTSGDENGIFRSEQEPQE